MNTFIIFNKELPNTVVSVEDKSDSMMHRKFLTFHNGFHLSIVRGPYSYGGTEGLFEIAPMKNQKDWAPEIFDECDQGADVLVYLTKLRVWYYINKIGNIPKQLENLKE